MPKKPKSLNKRLKRQTGEFLNRYDFAYADRDTVNSTVKHLDYRTPIVLKKVSGKADEILQHRISQLIKESGAEIERTGPKILRGAIEDLYKTPFRLVGRKLAQLKEN